MLNLNREHASPAACHRERKTDRRKIAQHEAERRADDLQQLLESKGGCRDCHCHLVEISDGHAMSGYSQAMQELQDPLVVREVHAETSGPHEAGRSKPCPVDEGVGGEGRTMPRKVLLQIAILHQKGRPPTALQHADQRLAETVPPRALDIIAGIAVADKQSVCPSRHQNHMAKVAATAPNIGQWGQCRRCCSRCTTGQARPSRGISASAYRSTQDFANRHCGARPSAPTARPGHRRCASE